MYRTTKTIVADHFSFMVVGIAAVALLWSLLLRHQPLHNMPTGLLVWWVALCGVSIFNICGWRLSATVVARSKVSANSADYLFQRRQLLLSAVFVLGCAFRSILPRADVQRIGLFDHWVSSVMLGRSVATIAE